MVKLQKNYRAAVSKSNDSTVTSPFVGCTQNIGIKKKNTAEQTSPPPPPKKKKSK